MISINRSAGVVCARLNRPDRRNALDQAMLAGLDELVQSVTDDDRVLLLTAQGPAFSAGADLAGIHGDLSDLAFDDQMDTLAATLAACPLPTMVAVDGPCLGAAVDLVSRFDVVVASTAARFQVPAVSLGLLYNPSAIQHTSSRVSPALATRMFLLGEDIPADAAAQHGLVDVLVRGEATSHAQALAASLATAPTRAARATAHVLRELRQGQFDASAWQQQRHELLASPERRAAVQQARARLGLDPTTNRNVS